jgi:hypothetical protein
MTNSIAKVILKFYTYFYKAPSIDLRSNFRVSFYLDPILANLILIVGTPGLEQVHLCFKLSKSLVQLVGHHLRPAVDYHEII